MVFSFFTVEREMIISMRAMGSDILVAGSGRIDTLIGAVI